MHPVGTGLVAAMLALATFTASAQTCADLGQTYSMYTYKEGNRVGVDSGTSPRRFTVWLECRYDAAAEGDVVDLGFGRVCSGQEVKVQGKACKIAKVDSSTAKLEFDPQGRMVQRRSGVRPSLR